MSYGGIGGITNYEQLLADVLGKGSMSRDLPSTKIVICGVHEDEQNN